MSRSWLRKGVLVAAVSVFVALAALPAVQAQQQFARGAVVALQGTPHLWIADEQGVLHWGSDTRALEGKHINWSDRTEVSLEQIRTLPVGDPWLSACGLLKDGNPIYLVKWETEWPRPQLFHIQSIGDVELFGINASNYGRFVVSVETCDEWAQPHGFAMADLQRDVLPTAVPQPAPTTPTPPPTMPNIPVFTLMGHPATRLGVSDGSVTITILPDEFDDGGSPIIEYTAQGEFTNNLDPRTASFTDLQGTLSGIFHYGNYQVRVRAENSVGTSAWSDYQPVHIPPGPQ